MPIGLTKKHLTYMNIGARYWPATLDGLTKDQATAVQPYLSRLESCLKAGIGLYLWGNNGTGKSYITAALCMEVWRTWRVKSFCVTAAELKESWIEDRPLGDRDESVVQRSETARFLVIDDIGKEHRAASGFAETKFGALLRLRSRSKLVTSLTSNLNPKEFGAIYGESAADLSKECMHPIKLKTVSLRSDLADRIHRSLKETT